MSASAPDICPANEAELITALTAAVKQKTTLEIKGTGSRQSLGRPMETDGGLSLAAFSGISLYEPDELVMTVGAATPLSEVIAALDHKGQMLAFDPPLGSLKAGDAKGSIGGIIATNLSGPRRLSAGAARDYILGFKSVSGRGEAFQSGGRVVKNVTGYDLSKLMAGSFGTLAALHEITLKTMPKPKTATTLLVALASASAAFAVISGALSSAHEVAAASIIPAEAAALSSISAVRKCGKNGCIVVLRLEGIKISVAARVAALKSDLAEHGLITCLEGGEADRLNAEIREQALLPEDKERVIWKISCPPSQGASCLEVLKALPDTLVYSDWGGGLIWASRPMEDRGSAELLRGEIGGFAAHAMLFKAPDAIRAELEVMPPLPEAVMRLTRRIKNGFDPEGILNPGRMYRGI